LLAGIEIRPYMNKICILVGMTILGWFGWWVGSKLGGLLTAFLLSGVGSLLGVYVGWLINRDYLN
jgi:hypothetical protein